MNQPDTPDILGRVDDEGRLLCECGCQQPITDRSPSAYFASELCSARWHTTAAGEALPSPRTAEHSMIAVVTFHGRLPRPDPEPENLRDTPAAAWLGSVDPQFVEPAVLHVDDGVLQVEILRQPRPLAYTRQCGRCSRVAPPVTVSRPAPLTQPVPAADLIQSCPGCGEQHLAAFLTFVTITGPADNIRLEITDGRFRAAGDVPPPAGLWDGDLHAVEEASFRAGRMWRRLERILTDFAENWPVRAPTPPSGSRPFEPYTFNVFPTRHGLQLPPWLGNP